MQLLSSTGALNQPEQSAKRQEAINRTEKEIGCIKALIDPRYTELIGIERTANLRNMLAHLEVLHKKLVNNTFEVSIVGLEKSGKSTFANAFMGIDILPTKDERCTYTTTSIR